jgi:hypothetical protein
MDKKITCNLRASYTVDYRACVRALNLYNAVVVAELAMNTTQRIQTDLRNQDLQRDVARRSAQGDTQGAALDAAQASQQQQRTQNQQKLMAFGTAVVALGGALAGFPGESAAAAHCGGQVCQPTVRGNRSSILGNSEAKAALILAASEYAAKAIAAGFAMRGNESNIAAVEAARKATEQEQQDLMLEPCQFNPTDPACLRSGNRVAGSGAFRSGEFNLGGAAGNNAFDMTPPASEVTDPIAATNLGDKNEVAGVNSPFVDDAREAKKILNPAGAAQAQATGGAQGGAAAGGGAAGGMGGGSASLGNDLQGKHNEGDKEAQIRTSKVSGMYSAAGGGGFKGVSGGKDEANPFNSLFDQQGQPTGGVEEDRSIASSDIDGKASGLFEKISRRYGQVQADKRIEANNLE